MVSRRNERKAWLLGDEIAYILGANSSLAHFALQLLVHTVIVIGNVNGTVNK
jgi:hypothetical protein